MSEFVRYLNEVFESFGPIQAKKMFGGYGIYHQGIMFGLVADDMLYLKADKTTAHHFSVKGLDQFEYDKGDKKIKMSYYLAPPEMMEDPDETKIWAARAYDVAFRTKKKTRKK